MVLRSCVLLVEGGAVDVGELDVFFTGGRGGQERSGCEIVNEAGDAAAALKDLLLGGGAKECLRATGGAQSALEIVARLLLGQRRERSANGDPLRERRQLRLSESLAQCGLANKQKAKRRG